MAPRPTQDAIVHHYDSGATYQQWQVDRVAREQMWRRRLRRIQRIAPPGRLLDIGTGDGHFLDLAAAAGYTVTGTEVSSNGAARANRHEIAVGDLRTLDFGGRSFDIITMWHVLEHVPDPGDVLARVFRLLEPNGLLFVAVPNERRRLLSAAAGASGRSPFGDGTFREGEEIHLTFFTPATLRRALQRAGFRVHRIGVDNVYLGLTVTRRLKLGMHHLTSVLTGSHLGMAMQTSARRP